MGGESRIDILIAARDAGVAGVVQGVNSELGGLTQGAGAAGDALSAMGEAVLAAGAVKLSQQIFDLAQLSAQADRARNSFDTLAKQSNTTGAEMLAAMHKASAGTISDTNLEIEANKARVLGVATNTQQLTQLLGIARAQGAEFGVSTKEAFDTITEGVGRLSARMLTSIGITINEKDAYDQYAATLGKTADALSDTEKRQALLAVVIDKTRDSVAAQAGKADDAETSFERLGAAVDNAKVRLGALFAPEVVKDIDNFVNALDLVERKLDELGKNNAAVTILNSLKQASYEVINPLGAAGDGAFQLAQKMGLIGPSASDAATAEQHLEDNHARLTVASDAAADAAQRLSIASKVASFGINQEEAAVVTLAGALPGLAAAATAASLALTGARAASVSRLAGAAAGVEDIVGSEQATKLYNAALGETDTKIQAVNAEFAAGKLTQDEFQLKLAEIGTTGGGAFDAIHQAQQEAESSAKKLASTVSNDATRAYDELKGKVSGVLSGALQNDTGVDPDKILGRSDAINEPARRLADIAVNGFKSPWVSYFKTQFPALFQEFFSGAAGDTGIKQSAAQLLKNFQDGLEPELLDKEKAKERVRRMLIGEQKMADLAKEITAELNAELGNTAPADLAGKVQSALTGGTGGPNALAGANGQGATAAGTAGGASAGAAFSAAVAQSGAGAGDKLIAALDASLKADANVTLIKTAGQSAGNNWGGAFLSTVGNNVPKALIDLLTHLVTPGVLAYFNTQSQLTGAQP